MIKPSEMRILEQNVSFFCDPGCKFLNIQEMHQKNSKQPHVCTKYRIKLLHETFHPHLVKPFICVSNEFSKIDFNSLRRDVLGI